MNLLFTETDIAVCFPSLLMKAVMGNSKAALAMVLTINFYCLFIAYNYSSFTAPEKQQRILYKVKTKTIGFWTGFFGDRRWGLGDGTNDTMLQCRVHRCMVVRNVKDPMKCDALVFHIRDAHRAPAVRHPSQVYLALLQENPYYRGNGFVRRKAFYNWTATYYRKSDIYLPYFLMQKNSSNVSDVDQFVSKLPQLTHNLTAASQPGVCWVVSHCKTAGKREAYVAILRKHIHIDTFGRCGKRCPSKNCLKDLAKTGRYMFYLSFENAACKDYITEKLSNVLQFGLVPVVYGGLSHADYVEVLPKHSFIDVRNFTSAKRLADYLFYLQSNITAYVEYFQWRSDYVLSSTNWQCAFCEALYNRTMMRPRSIDFANFMNTRDCDPNLARYKG